MRRSPAAAAFALVALLAGCTSIPTSGPVRSGSSADAVVAGEQPQVESRVEDPPRGADRTSILSGFLAASVDRGSDGSTPGSFASARRYLTQAAAARWRPERGVTVYSSDPPGGAAEIDDGGEASTGSISVLQSGSIDGDGRYRPLPARAKRSLSFRFAREHDEWRISGLADGVLLPEYRVASEYTPRTVYFLDPARDTLVPDLLLLPSEPVSTTATTLVAALLDGPTSWLAPGVTTAFPAGAALSRAAVPVSEDRVASVDLNDAVRSAPVADQQGLAAQVVWTLTHESATVDAVRITADGRALDGLPDGALDQSDFTGFDPDVLDARATPYLVRDGQLGVLKGTAFSPRRAPVLPLAAALGQFAVGLRDDRVAGVSVDGRTIAVNRTSPGGVTSEALTGRRLTGPSWDDGGDLWAVDELAKPAEPSGGLDGALWLVPPAGDPVRVTLASAAARPPTAPTARAAATAPTGRPRTAASVGRLRAARVSRDGTRVAYVVRRPNGHDDLLVGVVQRLKVSGRTVIKVDADAVDVAPEGLTRVVDLAWTDAAHLAVLGLSNGDQPDAPELVPVDGYQPQSLPRALPDANGITAAPGQLVATTGDKKAWSWTGSAWVELLDQVTGAAFPG